MAKKGGGSKKPVPRIRLEGEPIQAERITFSTDGRVLMASNGMLESQAWDVAGGKPVVRDRSGTRWPACRTSPARCSGG